MGCKTRFEKDCLEVRSGARGEIEDVLVHEDYNHNLVEALFVDKYLLVTLFAQYYAQFFYTEQTLPW